MVPEARLEETGAGFVPAGQGWFVLNACDAQWHYRQGKASVSFTGRTAFEAETYFPQLGVNLVVLEPGEPNAMYHWEADQEDFLVLYGEALLVVEGQERRLRPWDFVHCPPETRHVFVGAGTGPCAILATSSRQFQASDRWGGYVPDEAARRHGASPDEETDDAEVAYARVPASESVAYRDGWLP